MSIKSYVWRLRSRTEVVLVLILVTAYVGAFQYFRQTSFRDPTSAFFDPNRGFDRFYSDLRQSQAEHFIRSSSSGAKRLVRSGNQPSICAGIVTVQREGATYFEAAVGSILEGLYDQEREDIYLTTIFAQSDPTQYFANNETWVHTLFDQVLTYESFPHRQTDQIARLEMTDKDFAHKPLLDYVLLLEACLNTSAPYIMIVEDDVIALHGWLHRTKTALQYLEQQPDLGSSVYLRLFYTDKFLGWNSEHWPRYLFWSILAEAVLICALLALKHGCPAIRRHVTLGLMLFCLVGCSPACIVLFFAAGRLTVMPPPRGLHRLNEYGCCSQAFVFPRSQVPELMNYYSTASSGKIDSLTEEYADERGLTRWAVTPVLFQHVGSLSATRRNGSGLAKWHRSPSASIWNSEFELNDATDLRTEQKEFWERHV